MKHLATFVLLAAGHWSLATGVHAQSVPFGSVPTPRSALSTAQISQGSTSSSATVLRNWSTTQPAPAASSVSAGNAVRASNVVTLTVADTTGLAVNDWIEARGFTSGDVSFNLTRLTATITRSGSTATVDTGATAHNLAVGMLVNIEGGSDTSYIGAYAVATVPTSTTYTVTLPIARGGTATSATSVSFAKITGLTGTTITYAHAGSDLTSSGTGTVQSVKLPRHVTGTTWAEPLGSTVEVLCDTNTNPAGAGGGLRNFYSTGTVGNAHYRSYPEGANPRLLVLDQNSSRAGMLVINPTDCSLVRNLGGSGGLYQWSNATWNLLHTVQSSRYVRGYNPEDDTFTATYADFGAGTCPTAFGIGGPITGNEGHVSGNDRYLPIFCRNGTTAIIAIVDKQTSSIKWQVDVTATFGLLATAIDNVHAYNDGSAAIVTSTSGTNISSMSRTGETVTVNLSSSNAPQVGQQIRILRSTTAANGLYTVATRPSDTQFTYEQPGKSTSALTAGQWCGPHVGIVLLDSSGAFENCVESSPNHGDSLDYGGARYFVVDKNSSNGPDTGTNLLGIVALKMAPADWSQESARNAEAQIALIGLNGASGPAFNHNSHIGADPVSGFVAVEISCGSTSGDIGYQEASIGSDWATRTITGKDHCYSLNLVHVSGGTVHRMAHYRNRDQHQSTYQLGPFVNFDGVNLTWSTHMADPSSANPQSAIVRIQPCGGKVCIE